MADTEKSLLLEPGLTPYEREELLRSRERIRQLQDNVFSLRMSRRVLMSLLEQVQASQQEEIDCLQKQNARLQKQNHGYAGRLMEQNRRIFTLQQKLEADNMQL